MSNLRRTKAGDLVQLFSAIAIIAGIVLVVWELRQTQVLMRAQLSSEHFSEELQNARALLGENPTPALVKSCGDPRDLSAAEREMVLAAMDMHYFVAVRSLVIEEIADLGIDWEAVARPNLTAILSNPVGRYDYETYKDTSRWHPALGDIAADIHTNDDLDCFSFWSSFDHWLTQSMDDRPGT